MNLNIKATNLQLTSDIREYLEKKLNALNKVADISADNVYAHVELAKTTKHHRTGNVFKAEINIRISGHEFMAIAEEADIHAAIDIMKDELLREIKTGKEKFMTKVKKGGAKAKDTLHTNNDNTNEQ